MKMEQACRFRTDEAGYMVCARSQGLTADNENNLGYFNSTMTSLFEKDGSGPRMGQSILSYAVSEENGGRRRVPGPTYAAAPEPDPGYGAGGGLLRGHGHASRSALETDVQQRRGYPGGHLCFQQGRRRRHGDPAVYL